MLQKIDRVRRFCVVFSVALLAFSMVFVSPVGASPVAEVWVDDDWAGSSIGDTVDGHTFGTDAFATIQDGVDNVDADGVVHVAAGVYRENVDVNKRLTLSGEDRDTTIVDGGYVDDAIHIGGSGDGSVVEKFTVVNGQYYGIGVDYADECHILDCTVYNCSNGIYAWGSSGCHISGCDSHNNTWSGISVDYCRGWLISECVVYDNEWEGIYAYCSPETVISGCEVHDNEQDGMYVKDSCQSVIQDCVIYNNTNEGVELRSDLCVVSGCQIYNNTGEGVYVHGAENVVYGCVLYNNTYGIHLGCSRSNTIMECDVYENEYNGIWFSFSDRNLAVNCTINHNRENGVYGDSADHNWVRRCQIRENMDDGIHLYRCRNWTIAVNNITRNSDEGIYCSSGSGPTIRCNNITENVGYGVRNGDSSITVDAEYNWWGDPSGPSGVGSGTGDEVSNYVNYGCWLLTPMPSTYNLGDLRYLFVLERPRYFIPLKPTGSYAFADPRSVFVLNDVFPYFDALIVYGESQAHTLWGSRTIDVVGGTSIATAFAVWSTDRVSPNNQLDVDVYDDTTEEFLLEFQDDPLIAVGGPNVNWGFWHHNHYIPHETPDGSPLWAYFRWAGGTYPTGWPEVYVPSTDNSYKEEWVTETEIYSYAIVELHWDTEYDRPVLLVAGICGPATRAACDWLADRMLNDSILTEGYTAFVLRVRMVQATGEVTEITAAEGVLPT